MTTITITVNPYLGSKYPATIRTANQTYSPRGMNQCILFFANRYALRNNLHRFLPRLTVNPDPNEGEAK